MVSAATRTYYAAAMLFSSAAANNTLPRLRQQHAFNALKHLFIIYYNQELRVLPPPS